MSSLDIYRLGCDSDATVRLQTSLDFFKDHFKGTPLLREWKAPELTVLGRSKPLKDFIGFSLNAPTVSERAMQCLLPVIGPYCEFLPLITLKSTQYYAINTLYVADCLDLPKCHVVRSDRDNRILSISTFFFIEDKVPDVPIFTVQPPGDVFVRQAFVDCVKKNLLTNAKLMDPSVNQLPLIALGLDTNVVPYLPM